MGKSLIMHIDQAPWLHGGPDQPGEEYNQQLIGDREKGPWVNIISLDPGRVAPPHSHSQDEVIYIVDGELTMGDRVCGPGTVLFIERDTEYGFVTGSEGVRFLNLRPGPARFSAGE